MNCCLFVDSFFLCMRLIRIKIFTCASRFAYPHMRNIHMNRMGPQLHGQFYSECQCVSVHICDILLILCLSPLYDGP